MRNDTYKEYDSRLVNALLELLKNKKIEPEVAKKVSGEYLKIERHDHQVFLSALVELGRRYPVVTMVFDDIVRALDGKESSEKIAQSSQKLGRGDVDGALEAAKTT